MPRYPDLERTVKRFLAALEAGDQGAMEALLDDTFVYRQADLPEDMDKAAFLALVRDLHQTYPFLNLHPQLQVIGDRVDGEIRVGVDARHGNGFAAQHAPEHASWNVHNGRITRHDVHAPADGGLSTLVRRHRDDGSTGSAARQR